jgi:hypothetical protein
MRLIGKKPKEQKPIEEAPPAQFNVNLPNIGSMPMRH